MSNFMDQIGNPDYLWVCQYRDRLNPIISQLPSTPVVNPNLLIVIFAVIALCGLTATALILGRQRTRTASLPANESNEALPGIDAFRSQIRQAFQKSPQLDGSPISLILLDMDHLARVNDLYGRQVGDQLIQLCIKTIRGNVRKTDPIGRTAGQQFAILVAAPSEPARNIAERLLVAIRKAAHPVGTHMLKLTASAGVATAPTHAKGVEDLIQSAVIALKAAKSAGRNRVVLFNPEIQAIPARFDKPNADRL